MAHHLRNSKTMMPAALALTFILAGCSDFPSHSGYRAYDYGYPASYSETGYVSFGNGSHVGGGGWYDRTHWHNGGNGFHTSGGGAHGGERHHGGEGRHDGGGHHDGGHHGSGHHDGNGHRDRADRHH
jgi:hypothetical protein